MWQRSSLVCSNEIKSSKEEFARDMGQNSINAAAKDEEQCAKGTGQRSSDAS